LFTVAGSALALRAPLRKPPAEVENVLCMTQEEFRSFYEETSGPLWRYLARAGRSEDLADDLLQEAYYRILRIGFRGDSKAHRKNYLFRVATNLLRDHFRSPKSTETPLTIEPSSEVVAQHQVEVQRDLGQAMEKLKLRDRQLLWLAHVEGLSHHEVAEVLGVKAPSVRLMVFRARKRLAELLREQGYAPEVTT
jgi:RNA polymerase sigma-70 factor (ECF subfamily)